MANKSSEMLLCTLLTHVCGRRSVGAESMLASRNRKLLASPSSPILCKYIIKVSWVQESRVHFNSAATGLRTLTHVCIQYIHRSRTTHAHVTIANIY